MMGKKNSPLSFTNIEHLISIWAGLPVIPQDSVYAALSRDQEIFRDELFADAYASVGHPSKSPAFLCKVLLLQFLDNASDREAEEKARDDLRWKAALGVGLPESGFDATLSKFRIRLLLFQKERVVFECILQKAAEKGIISHQQTIQIMDRSGGGREYLRGHLRRHPKAFELTEGKTPGYPRLLEGLKLDYRERKKPANDWNDPKAREALLNDLVTDAMLVLDVTGNLSLRTENTCLEKVTFQDSNPRQTAADFKSSKW